MKKHYDIIIIGAGLTGAAMAVALANSGLKIAIIDNKTISYEKPVELQDMRSIALSYASQQIFSALGIWNEMQMHACPIRHIHVSDQGQFGFTRIDAKQHQVDALGYVVPFEAIHNTLIKNLKEQANIDTYESSEVVALEQDQTKAYIRIQNADEMDHLEAKLIIAADGGNSKIRQLMNIDIKTKDYEQIAIVGNVGTQKANQWTAYERFTKSGPIALLPLNQNSSAYVWTVAKDKFDTSLLENKESLLANLQREFGYRLGRLTWVGKSMAFPLKLSYAKSQYHQHVVLIGNASHNIHPVAGQGFNLGLRDVAELAELMSEYQIGDKSISDNNLLQQYAVKRKKDHQTIINLTDNLIRVFANENSQLSLIRNLGLVALDVMPSVKSILSKRTMGFYKNMPKLALGIPLWNT